MRRHQQISENSDEHSGEILVGTNETFSIYPNQGPRRLTFQLAEDGCDASWQLFYLLKHLLNPGETTGGGD